ncbi:MAG TPA: sulfate ABC transporter permease subunit [Actinomycetota bacterium]
MSETRVEDPRGPGAVEDLTLAERAANFDARRGRRVRGLMITVSLLYVGILLVAPLAGIVSSALKGGTGNALKTFSDRTALHALWLTFLIMLVTVAVTTVLGVVVALVLARDRFPGKRLLSAVVDLPLGVSPVIVGLMAVLLFGNGGWFQSFFAARGIQIIFALPSMILVTVFISIPFVIREVVPVLQELGMEEEQAAWTLGASRLQTFFRVTLPNIRWGLLYGIALSAARAIGEVGAVLIVSGSLQGQTETATLFILRVFDQSRSAAQEQPGFVIALTLALFSVVLLIGIEFFKRREIKEAHR